MRKTIQCRYKKISDKDKECLIHQFQTATKLRNTVYYNIKRTWNCDRLNKDREGYQKKLTTDHRKVRVAYQDNMHYKQLHSHVGQELIKSACQDYKSFFAKIKRDRKANIPKINKLKYPPLLFSKGISLRKLKDGKVVLSIPTALKEIYGNGIALPFPPHLSWEKVKCVMLYPKNKTIIYNIIYEDGILLSQSKNDGIMGIDLGISNISTVVSLKNYKGWIYKTGKLIHKLNCLHSLIGKEKNKLNKSKLYEKRTYMLKDYMHRLSNMIIAMAEVNEIGLLIIGKNKNWKQKSNMGRENNRLFYSLNHNKLIDYLKYKGEQKGIKVVVQEESYTSKCSFLDKEEIGKHKEYQGRRVKRGLFQTSEGKLINADINGALNITKKYFDNNKITNNYVSKKWLSYPTKITLK